MASPSSTPLLEAKVPRRADNADPHVVDHNGEPERLAHDTERRQRMAKAVKQKLKEIDAIRERLFALRYDTSRSEADIVQDVKNLQTELARLELEFQALRRDSERAFESSLQLHKLPGYDSAPEQPARLRSQSVKTAAAAQPEEPQTMTMEEVAAQKFMRTRSTATLEDKTPADKWRGLFRMFKEWKHHKQAAEAAIIADKEREKLKEEQITKLRSAIYSLNQRKKLSATDQELLRKLQAKLKKLQQSE